MRWTILIVGVVLVVAGLYLRWQDGADEDSLTLIAEPRTLRDTDAGPVVGGISPAGAQVWLGIPYAQAPKGELRWRAPRKPGAWLDPRAATEFAPPCPQFANGLSLSRMKPGTLIGSEDCLFLNVFAPAQIAPGADLPVMVFIHGGGNTQGSALPYDGSTFVQEQGVIMVTIQYRLGPLGWFSHRALREAGSTPEDRSGNFALLDMVAALKWVQRNIDAFGGDSGRVTVFGESAGARNIYSLLVSPLAEGLFHGAIIQSGYPGSFSLARAEHGASDPQPGHSNSSANLLLAWLQESSPGQDPAHAQESLERLPGARLLEFMRSLSTAEVLAPVWSAKGTYAAPALFRDGYVLPTRPLPDVFADGEGWNKVHLLVGSNRDEIKLYLAMSERHVQQRFGLFPQPRDPERYAILSRLHSDAWKAAGVDLPLTAISDASPEVPLYAYRFDWDDMLANWFVDLPELLGAAHALDLDFLFGPLISRVVPGVFHGANRERREALGAAMRDYWAGFAYTGRPGSGRSATRPVWPRWEAAHPRLMLLDETRDGGLRVEEVSVTVDGVKAAIGETQALPVRLRCAIYVDLFLHNNGLDELFDARQYQELGCGPFPARSLMGQSR